MKKRWWIPVFLLLLMFTSCQNVQDSVSGITESTVESTTSLISQHSNDEERHQDEKRKIMLSNMGDAESMESVRAALKNVLNHDSAEEYVKMVLDYNETIEYTGLIGSFEEREGMEYDILKMGELWNAKKGDFIGTNCRINSFLLLRRDIEVPIGEIDDSLLFFDNDAIAVGNLFEEKEIQAFRFLFSKVKTEDSRDIHVHAKKMEAHFKNVVFHEKARMISVILHDKLDGNDLFVGHVGVLVEQNGGYLFVEKLAFDQPYQAIKFNSKEECYRYLYLSYKHYCDPTSAKPFIMDNGKMVELDLYD